MSVNVTVPKLVNLTGNRYIWLSNQYRPLSPKYGGGERLSTKFGTITSKLVIDLLFYIIYTVKGH